MVEESAGRCPLSPVTSAEPEESLRWSLRRRQTSYYGFLFSRPLGETHSFATQRAAPFFGSWLAHPNHERRNAEVSAYIRGYGPSLLRAARAG